MENKELTRVLVVDDYIVNLELTKEILESLQCEVDTAENGEIALNLEADNPYDIILMDIQMPDMDGYEVTRKIRKREDGKKHTPIIAVTANTSSGEQDNCLKAGMDGFVQKPIRSRDLENILKKHIKS